MGDAGRPDLTANALTSSAADAAPAAEATQAAWTLYANLHRLLTLPDDLELYPAHFAGSSCGRMMSGKPSSTLGFERRFNPALQVRSPEDFAAFMLTDLPPAPLRHREIRAANRQA